MAAPQSPDSHEFRQMRNDVDDGYELLKDVQDSVIRISSTQRLHGNRLTEIQQSVDLAAGRLNRMEDNQRRQAEGLDRLEKRLDGVDGRLDGLDGRLEDLDGRLGRIEGTQQEILDLLRGRPAG